MGQSNLMKVENDDWRENGNGRVKDWEFFYWIEFDGRRLLSTIISRMNFDYEN
jgi:hypothetical protein